MIEFSPNPFGQIMVRREDLSKQKKTITREEYEQFKHEFIFDSLKGNRLGRAFCEKFEISDYLLSSISDNKEAEFLIESLGYIK